MFRFKYFTRSLLWSGIVALSSTIAIAQTSPTTLMQINGNAANDNLTCSYGTPCDYWNLLNGTGGTNGAPGNGSSAGHTLIRTFINGMTVTDSYTGGGSKDPNDLSQWKWSGTPTPNKDTLNAGYAAAYIAPDSSFHLTFGADRASPNGDANIGIWFFQNSVSLNPNGTFSGVHKNGDIFVISAFTGGGGNSSIQVLKWDTTCSSGVNKPTAGQCADSNLRLLVLQTSLGGCGSSPFCAVTNSATTNTTWEGPIASPLFFQGGVNLSAALGGGPLPCFSSFLEETRSSQSTSAVLKDFVLGGFPVCSIAITKTCDSVNNPPVLVNNGTQVLYTWKGTVVNTGVGALSNVSIDDTLPTNAVVHPTLFINGSPVSTLNAGDIATYSVTATLSALSAENKATAKGFSGTAEIDTAGAASATCSISPSSSVGITKSCVAPGPGLSCSAAGCVVQVPIKAHVCNLGPVRLTNVGVADSPSATLTPSSIPQLNPTGAQDGSDCADVTGTYTPTSAGGDGATNGRFSFSDTISVTSATPALGPAIQPVGGNVCPAGALACSPAVCKMCNAGECTQ